MCLKNIVALICTLALSYHLPRLELQVFIYDTYPQHLRAAQNGQYAVFSQFFYYLTFFKSKLVSNSFNINAFHMVGLVGVQLFQK